MINNNMSESGTECGVDYTSLLYNQNSEDEQILPQELSGDQNAQKNVLAQSNAFSHKKATLFLSITMLMKTVIGVGILSMPFVFSKMGIIPTIVCFLLAGILIQFTSRLLIKSKNLSGHSNYSSIMRHLHKLKCFKILASLLLMTGPLGSCIIDLMFFKRTVRKILEDTLLGNSILDSFYTSQYMILLAVATIQFPITLLNKIEKLRIFSFIGILGIILFIIAFVIDYGVKMGNNEGLRSLQLFPSDWNKAISTVPNIIFSLAFNTNFFPIFKGLEYSSDKRMLKVVTIGVFTCIVFYMTIGFLGYSITKTNITANFLQSIEYSDTNQILFILMNSGFLLSLLFAFPILFFSCRNNFILILKSLIEKQAEERTQREVQQEEDRHKLANASQILKRKAVYILYTSILFIIIVLVAMFVNSIQSVFNLVGAISASAVGFIFPMYFYIQLIYKKNKEKKGIYYFSILLMFLMILFCIFTVIALYI